MNNQRSTVTKITEVKDNGREIVLLQPNPPRQRVVVSQQNDQQKKKKKSRAARRRKAARSSGGTLSREAAYFSRQIRAPDLWGPWRQPRSGGAAKTGLAQEIYSGTQTGSGTNLVQFFQASTALFSPTTIASVASVATSGTALGTLTAVAPTSQYPAAATIADLNMTSCSMVVSYIGNPLNCSGEIIIGSAILVAAGATYDSLSIYPGVIRVPIATLINKPLRAWMQKVSTAADEFLPISGNPPDTNMPFFATLNLPAGQAIRVEVVKTYEFRSSTTTGAVVPYEKMSSSMSKDVAIYQDIAADLARIPAAVEAAVPPTTGTDAGAIASLMGGLGLNHVLGAGGVGLGGVLINAAYNYHMNRLRNGNNRPFMGVV